MGRSLIASLPTPPQRVVLTAAYFVVSGLILLLTKGIVLMPIVRWLRERSDAQIELLLRLGGKGLIAAGLLVIAVWGWQHRRTHRPT